MTLQELEQWKPNKLSVKDAAGIMEVSETFLCKALVQGKFPFGIGIDLDQSEYYINTIRFMLYMHGTDLGGMKIQEWEGITLINNVTKEEKKVQKITVAQAAEVLGKSQMYIRLCLRNGTLPIGSAVKGSSVWTYHISPKLLRDYIGNDFEI